MTLEACKSHIAASYICADGFAQKAFCSGRAGCFSCGNISDESLPWCLRDELPETMVNADGSPLFYKPNGEIK